MALVVRRSGVGHGSGWRLAGGMRQPIPTLLTSNVAHVPTQDGGRFACAHMASKETQLRKDDLFFERVDDEPDFERSVGEGVFTTATSDSHIVRADGAKAPRSDAAVDCGAGFVRVRPAFLDRSRIEGTRQLYSPIAPSHSWRVQSKSRGRRNDRRCSVRRQSSLLPASRSGTVFSA